MPDLFSPPSAQVTDSFHEDVPDRVQAVVRSEADFWEMIAKHQRDAKWRGRSGVTYNSDILSCQGYVILIVLTESLTESVGWTRILVSLHERMEGSDQYASAPQGIIIRDVLHDNAGV